MKKSVKYEDFNIICRLCLRKTNVSHIFGNVFRHNLVNKQNISLVQMIETYTNIKVRKEDDKPQNVCQSCVTQLSQSDQFFKMCAVSENSLNEALKCKVSPTETTNPCGNLHMNTINKAATNRIEIVHIKSSKSDNFLLHEIKSDPTTYDSDSVNTYLDLSNHCQNEILLIVKNEDGHETNTETDSSETVICDIEEPKKEELPNSDNIQINSSINSFSNGKPLKKISQTPRKAAKVISSSISKKSLFSCVICKKVLPKFRDVISHYDDVHSDIKRCIICNKLIHRSSKWLKYHMNTHRRKNIRYDCKKCIEYFFTREEMLKHFETNDHTSDPSTCKICGKKFIDPYGVKRHMESHENKQYQCSACNKIFRSSGGLIKHTNNKHKPDSFLCFICGRIFTSSLNMNRHIKEVHMNAPKPARPAKKHKVPVKKARLNNHVKCQFCVLEFNTVTGCRRHEMTAHPTQCTFKCNRCNKIFPNSEERRCHMNLVHIKYRCPDCDTGFANEEHYKKHIQLHESSDYLRCHICGTQLRTRNSYDFHMRNHSEDRPYKCEKCGKAFRQSTHYRYHVMMHTNQKPHACHLCSKTFGYKWHLESHLNVHEGRRPHGCQFCEKAYADKSTLAKHVKKIHSNLLEMNTFGEPGCS